MHYYYAEEKVKASTREQAAIGRVVRNGLPPSQVRYLYNLPIHTLVIVTVSLAIFSMSLTSYFQNCTSKGRKRPLLRLSLI
jgi:hypothetical protein